MSLTNPNTPVSQQDLQDFYHKLLPYMGGSFGMIANKFSKRDMYSTDEKMIGQWIDGKPLYQKTWVINEPITLTYNTWINTPIPSTNIKALVEGTFRDLYTDGSYVDASNIFGYISFAMNGEYIRILSTRETTAVQRPAYIITLKYTKTTDSAISIGDETDYSTDEKIVGTWVDGKPLYQKTVQIPSSAISSHSFTDSDLANADTKLIVSGYYYTTDLVMPLNQCEVAENTTHYTRAGFRKSDNSLYLYVVGYNNVQGAVATLQYTKTTD